MLYIPNPEYWIVLWHTSTVLNIGMIILEQWKMEIQVFFEGTRKSEIEGLLSATTTLYF